MTQNPQPTTNPNQRTGGYAPSFNNEKNTPEVVAHEKGHHTYCLNQETALVFKWWNALSLDAQTAYAVDPPTALRAAIKALISDQAVRNASEDFALTKNADYAAYVVTSEDWSQGGENDN